MATSFNLEHEEYHGRVCVVCYRKASRSLSQAEVGDIQKYLIEGYNVNDPDFPNGICTGCSLSLSKKRNDEDYNLVINVDDYDPNRPPGLLLNPSCECRICTVAKMCGLEYQRQRGRPKAATPDDSPTSYKVCSNCFASIYHGSNHSASACKHSCRSKVYNVEDLVQRPVTLERIAACYQTIFRNAPFYSGT